VLLSVTEQVGLDVTVARDVLQSRSCRDLIDADWKLSRRMGITGVPTFVVGDQGAVGAQPYEVLERLIVRAGAKRKS